MNFDDAVLAALVKVTTTGDYLTTPRAVSREIYERPGHAETLRVSWALRRLERCGYAVKQVGKYVKVWSVTPEGRAQHLRRSVLGAPTDDDRGDDWDR